MPLRKLKLKARCKIADIKWADVAHMYIKSGIWCQWNQIDEHGENTFEFDVMSYLDGPEDCKPILAHLEDITGEQAREYYTLKTGLPSKYVNRIIIRGKSADIVSVTYLKKFPAAKVIFVDIANKATPLGGQHTMKEFLWLIHHRFDLFSLIESGQAIRKEASNGL